MSMSLLHHERRIRIPRRSHGGSEGLRSCIRLLTLGVALVLGSLLGCDTSSFDSEPRVPSAGESSRRDPSLDADSNTSTPSASAMHRPRIVAFGDSLTAGLGVAPGDTYPAHLQRRLSEAGYQVRVINAGVSGETTAGGLRRVEWVLKSRPTLVILELGGNDGLRGIDPAHTRANLERIIEKFRQAEVPVVLVGMKLPPNFGVEFTQQFADVFPELARKYDLPFMPFFLEHVATHDELMQADGIHPTGKGYEVIVDNLVPFLEPLLADLAAARPDPDPRG